VADYQFSERSEKRENGKKQKHPQVEHSADHLLCAVRNSGTFDDPFRGYEFLAIEWDGIIPKRGDHAALIFGN
jgi:hypothetical protein